METREWARATTAKDLMVRDVLCLSPSDLVAKAASLLLRHQITGAPVVEASGECVGVFSASDVIAAEGKVAKEQQEIAQSSFWHSNLALPESVYAAKLNEVKDKLVPAAQQPVRRFMTSDLVTVDQDATLAVIARYMVDAHVHRVIVVDENRHLQGIISTTDVLAALLRETAERV